MRKKILVNTRQIDTSGMTGIKRYTEEILLRLEQSIVERVNVPEFWQQSIRGQIWDQTALALKKDQLLWSPANMGPVLHRNHVVTIHDIIPIDHPEWIPKKNALMFKSLMPVLAKNSRHIITVSEFSKKRIVEKFGVPHSKVSVTYLAADLRFAPLSTEEIYDQRSKNNWPERYILCVSNIEYRKNLIRLLNAWEIWDNKPKDLSLMIIGAGNSEYLQNKLGKIPDGVVIPGRIDEVLLPIVYACAELFVYPSIYEGFGLPPLEAMACGVPVVTANNTSVPEVTGDAAQLFDPFNVQEISNTIRRLVDQPQIRQEMREAGLQRANKFSWDLTARETREILLDKLNNP